MRNSVITSHVSSSCSGRVLRFRPVTLDDMPAIVPLLGSNPYRTCDFTVAGIFMWVDYFNYEFCIYRNTLFIKGVMEDDMSRPAFSMPVGELSLHESVALLRDYCRAEGCELQFSAIPEPAADALAYAIGGKAVRLEGWSDYLYSIDSLATLSGTSLKKKRNHVNRFMADNPGARLVELDNTDIGRVREFFCRVASQTGDSLSATGERSMVMHLLDNWPAYTPLLSGAVLENGDGRIVAFTIGETMGDTLYVHIEKMDHEVPGAGETINKLFARRMAETNAGLRWVNREEDVGDPGLRAAKESYRPAVLLHKYNVE